MNTALTPQPPLDMLVDPAAEHGIILVVGCFAAVALICALVHWAKTGRPIILSLFIAGGAMMIFEPMVDTAGACWFPKNSWVAFEGWGRPMPVWLCLSYLFYFGIGCGVLWAAMRRGVTRRQVWLIFVVAMLGDLVFEKVLLIYSPYVYYGWQPLRWGAFPLWWMAVNALIPIVTAAAVYRFEDALRGWKHVLIIPIALTASAAVNAGAGWPSWFVINTDVGPVGTQIGGLLTFALAFWFIGMVANLVATDARKTGSAANA